VLAALLTPVFNSGEWERVRTIMRKLTLRNCGTLTGLLAPLLLSACQDNAEICSTESSDDGSTSLVCLPVGGLGTSTLAIRRAEPAGDNCPSGGERIDTGFDDNGNNVLDTSEIDVSAYICDGADGSNGSSALVATEPEQPGDNCEQGGLLLRYGTDANEDGTLQTGEVEGSRYVCDGEDGTGPTGATGNAGVEGPTGGAGSNSLAVVDSEGGESCDFDGFALLVGVDDGASGETEAVAGDGFLHEDEIDDVEVVCIGDPGATGATGADGTNGIDGAPGARGADGLNGATGATGATGVTGTDGLDGTPGATGATGVTGTDGLAGAPGATGATGVTGTDGLDGATGATGATGVTGTDGLDGATGATGATGVDAASGFIAFQSFHLASLATDDVANNSAFIFSDNGITTPDVTHTAGASGFTIKTPGRYLFKYSMSLLSVNGGDLTLRVRLNGATVATFELDFGTSQQVEITAAAEDVIDLFNVGPDPITLNVAPAIGAIVEIQKLPDLP
jgi:collagen triple helix repeat protein